ncbi:MAG: NRDE family protein [Moraxellaceae bacterium]|nr:NRDE family protein [Moraxellaceae bacterium]
MCLIALAWQANPDYPLIVAANRDEFHHRPTTPARFWEGAPDVLAGRDLAAGGTWLGITRHGRFAALTNVREPGAPQGRRSRGLLVSGFLEGHDSPQDYAAAIASTGTDYSGFNLLVGDRDNLWWVSNRAAAPEAVAPGVHALSNHLFNTPWPKVQRARDGLAGMLGAPSTTALFSLLADDRAAPDDELPNTGVGLAMERMLSPPFIRSGGYGTRCSTVVLAGQQRIRFAEQTFTPEGTGERSEFSFDRR